MLKTFLLHMIRRIIWPLKQFQHVTHCTKILTWQVLAFRIIYVSGHYKRDAHVLEFCICDSLLTLMTHMDIDANCIFFFPHLEEVPQDRSGESSFDPRIEC